jgi:hypothetical protein
LIHQLQSSLSIAVLLLDLPLASAWEAITRCSQTDVSEIADDLTVLWENDDNELQAKVMQHDLMELGVQQTQTKKKFAPPTNYKFDSPSLKNIRQRWITHLKRNIPQSLPLLGCHSSFDRTRTERHVGKPVKKPEVQNKRYS